MAGSPAAAVTFELETTDDNIAFIIVTGQFQETDNVRDFVDAAANHNPSFVTFNSPGGSIVSAMALGRAIRALGLNTLQLRQLPCESACTLAFVGGVKRFAFPGALGVHRSYFADDSPLDRDQAVETSQHLTGRILSYLREMDVDPELLEVALEYSRDDMRYLSASEMARMRVTTEGPEAAPESTSASVRPTPPATPSPPPAPPRDVANEARVFVEHVINSHMLGADTAIQRVWNTYATSVEYYGQTSSIGDVVADKRRYFNRWPERVYQVQPNSVMSRCSGTLCEVSGRYEWAVRSHPRNKQAAGSATFNYWVDISAYPRIVGESSEVLSYY